jgi:RNA recognition motif-containing protein
MAAPSTKVQVSGLPDGTNDASVKEIFGAYGEIKWCKATPATKTALIEFAALDEAEWLVENLNGNIPEGLTTPVEVAFSSGKGKGGGKDGKSGGKAASKGSYGKADNGKSAKSKGPYEKPKDADKGEEDKSGGKRSGMKKLLVNAVTSGLIPQNETPVESQLYFRGLPEDCTDRDLYDLCAPFGAIPPKGVLAQKNWSGVCSGKGFVDFIDADCAKTCMDTLNGHEGLTVTPKQASNRAPGKSMYK